MDILMNLVSLEVFAPEKVDARAGVTAMPDVADILQRHGRVTALHIV